MRRWLALFVGVALLAVAGTALALNEVAKAPDDEALKAVTGEVDVTTTATVAEIEEKIDEGDYEQAPKAESEESEKKPERVREEPERSIPHKVAVDVKPPRIEILHPEEGQVFEEREVVFEGKTEPGSEVYAGKFQADVNERGGWRIVLVLDSGRNEVTVKAIDSAGNIGTDSVTVVYQAPKPKEDKPRVEEREKEEPKGEEPKEENHEKEEPREEEHPKEEAPGDDEVEWEFSAHQVYGECGETPPFDVFHGTGKPGSVISVGSEFGGGTAEVGPKGGWEIKVIFEGAPVGKTFEVHIEDQFGNHKGFAFTRVG